MGKLPDIFTELEISFFLLRRLLGVKTDGDKKKAGKVQHLLHTPTSFGIAWISVRWLGVQSACATLYAALIALFLRLSFLLAGQEVGKG